METGAKHTTAPPLASPYSSASSNQSCNSNMGGTNGNGTTGPNSFDQSFNRSNSMGQMGPGGNNNPAGSNNHLLYSQQQQHQRQQQHLQYMSRMSSSDSEYPLFPDHMKGGVVNNPYGPHPGMNKMGGGVLPPGGAGLTLQQQQQQQRQQQFSYTQRMFGYGSTEPEPKKKRGRPRKNETREPGTKRQYKRKPKVPPTPTGTNPAVPSGEMPPMGSMGGMQGVNQPPVGARVPLTGGGGMSGGRPQQQMGNVYNFEDEEGNEDLGSIMPRRPPGSAQSQKQQKYSFGSSSDEEIPRPPPGAQHHPGMMGARPLQGIGGQYHQQYPNQQHPHHYPQHGMGGVHGNQLMSAVHQKPPTMGIGTISGIGSIRGSSNVAPGMGGRPMGNPNMQQQHMQQQHNMQQQQQRPNEQGQMAEEDCSYSSEILTNEKTGGIGIKIKIKKAADTNTTTTQQRQQQ